MNNLSLVYLVTRVLRLTPLPPTLPLKKTKPYAVSNLMFVADNKFQRKSEKETVPASAEARVRQGNDPGTVRFKPVRVTTGRL